MVATLQAGAGGLKFSPTTVTIGQGGTLNVSNVSTRTHTFTIQSQAINQVIMAGQSATIAINLAPGTYPFVCTIHQSSGMTGTLVVT